MRLFRLVVVWLCVAAGAARADEPQPDSTTDEPKVAWAMGAGVATALVPMAIGGAFFAGTFDTTTRRDATIGMLAGFALAPIVSHLVVKEWTRAAIFGAVPLACAIGTAVLLELQPSADVYGTREGRLSFGLLLSFATLSSGIGLVDTLFAVRRHDERKITAHVPVLPVPFATVRGGGLAAGGLF